MAALVGPLCGKRETHIHDISNTYVPFPQLFAKGKSLKSEGISMPWDKNKGLYGLLVHNWAMPNQYHGIFSVLQTRDFCHWWRHMILLYWTEIACLCGLSQVCSRHRFFFMRSLIEHYVYHCGWEQLRPRDFDFSQNWKPGTGEIPLLSLWLGAIEAQWFRLQHELEAQGPGRFPYSHCGWEQLRPMDSDFSQNWKPGTGEIHLLSLWLGAIEAQWFRLQPELETWDRGDSSISYFWMISMGLLGAWITGDPHTTQLLINQSSSTGQHVEIKWSGTTGTWTWDHLILGRSSCTHPWIFTNRWQAGDFGPMLLQQKSHLRLE
jgi:hypothetical protein